MPTRSNSNPGVISNTAAVMLGLAGASGLALVVNLLVIAGFGAAAHGQVTLVLSTAYLGTLLCDLGLASKAGVRRIARLRQRTPDRLGRVVGENLTILFAVALLAGVVVIVGSPLVGELLDVPGYALRQAGLWLFAGAGLRACFMVFIGFERMGYLLWLSPAAELARLLWVGVCLLAGFNLYWLYLGWSVCWVGSLLVCAGLVLGLLYGQGVRPVWTWAGLRIRRLIPTLGHSLAYHLPLLTNQALGPLVLLMTGLSLDWLVTKGSGQGHGPGEAANVGQAQVSALQVCFMLGLIVRIVSQGLATSLFPAYVRDALESTGQRVEGRAVRILAGAVVLCFGIYVAFGQWGLGLVDRFNPNVPSPSSPVHAGLYAAAWPTLLVLTASLGIDSFRVQVDQWLMSGRHVGVVVRGELVKIVLLIVFIPIGTWLGPWLMNAEPGFGAAVGLLLAVTAIAVARAWSTQRHIGQVSWSPAWRGLVGVVVLSAIASLVSQSDLPRSILRYSVLPGALILIFWLRLIRWADVRSVLDRHCREGAKHSE